MLNKLCKLCELFLCCHCVNKLFLRCLTDKEKRRIGVAHHTTQKQHQKSHKQKRHFSIRTSCLVIFVTFLAQIHKKSFTVPKLVPFAWNAELNTFSNYFFNIFCNMIYKTNQCLNNFHLKTASNFSAVSVNTKTIKMVAFSFIIRSASFSHLYKRPNFTHSVFTDLFLASTSTH